MTAWIEPLIAWLGSPLAGQQLPALDIEQLACRNVEPLGQRRCRCGQRQQRGECGQGPHFEDNSVSNRR